MIKMMDKRHTGKRKDQQKRQKTYRLKDSQTMRQTDKKKKGRKKKRNIAQSMP